MDRDPVEDERDKDHTGVEDIGTDDEEFSSLDDVGLPPSENPHVDDI